MPIALGEPFWRIQFRTTFAAFRHRNYKLWFAGQLISLLGSWMQITAQGFLVYELTRSSEYLGYVAFAAGIPSWLFMLWAGVVADRMSRRALLIITQGCMLVLALLLAALTFAGAIQPWHILVLACGLGVANAFDAPARQAIVMELVGREDLTNAIALNSIMFNSATALGPAAAGLIYAWLGPGWCFAINAASFLAVIVALALMRFPARAARTQKTSAARELSEGLRFVMAHPHIRVLVGLVVVVALFGISFVTLMPAWAVAILGGDATTNGFLHSARGIGALLGALLIASLGRFQFHGRLLTMASLGFPLALIAFAFIRVEWLALVVLVAVGIGMILVFNLANALVQTLTPDGLRGRVMAIYSLGFFGFMPLGGLLAGALAERIGEQWTVVVCALLVVLFSVAVRIFQPGLNRMT